MALVLIYITQWGILFMNNNISTLHCTNIYFGSYYCYKETKYGFDVDGCLVKEINKLNSDGIKTIGCCCGHGRKQGYIQVAPEFVSKMLKFRYEQLPIDKNGDGQWCFKPKTILPFC